MSEHEPNPNVKSFVIDRARWHRGKGSQGSRLQIPPLREQTSPEIYGNCTPGNRCCLGFYAIAVGLSEASIIDFSTPGSLHRNLHTFFPEWARSDSDVDSDAITKLVQLNDDLTIGDKARERAITEIFAKHGVTVTFAGDPR